MSGTGFTSPFSLFTIGRQIGIDTMIGLAMMAVIVTGGLDLSVGAIGVCAAMVFGYLAQIAGVPLPLAIPLAIAFGSVLGFINGYVVVRSGVHSFIITLASMSIFFGIMIPQIAGTILVVWTTITIIVLKVFDIVLAMTNGQWNSQVLANLMFDWMFRGGGDFGRGAAIAIVIMVLVIPIMVWNIRNVRKETR